MASVLPQIEAWCRGTPEQRRLVAEAVHVAQVHAQRRRTALLAYPDLAGRLADSLELSSPQNWSGYVPPSEDGRNWSPVRRLLVELLQEAKARQDTEAAA